MGQRAQSWLPKRGPLRMLQPSSTQKGEQRVRRPTSPTHARLLPATGAGHEGRRQGDRPRSPCRHLPGGRPDIHRAHHSFPVDSRSEAQNLTLDRGGLHAGGDRHLGFHIRPRARQQRRAGHSRRGRHVVSRPSSRSRSSLRLALVRCVFRRRPCQANVPRCSAGGDDLPAAGVADLRYAPHRRSTGRWRSASGGCEVPSAA